MPQIKRKTRFVITTKRIFSGEGGGSRTRVRKPLHTGISERSLSSTFPRHTADRQAVRLSSPCPTGEPGHSHPDVHHSSTPDPGPWSCPVRRLLN